MILNSDSIKPIYIQIAEWLETEILGGSLGVDAKVHSQYQLAEMLNINPATAAKGLNLLADDGILYKKRGLGMFVSTEAKSIILSKRKNQTLARLVEEVVKEAEHLHVGEDELVAMIMSAKSKLKGEGK
ncbi:GntR family transcriptional regulator [Rossellomorea vietnamensis]|uniref:GntR family transcriptional regulator n=1 Tax=Rossellomorea vietnamensis TaxID=218284 RepID=A0A5D4NRK8_9BACI|nr:GntR family transcriptional regulator [Rossellomorea vietnamensis]TYS16995.1 GntR family transcriptional regulator [Rossellomorea vietnamensis]